MKCHCCHCHCDCDEKDKKPPKYLNVVWTNADPSDDDHFTMTLGETVTVHAGRGKKWGGTEWGKFVRKKDGTLWIYPTALVVEINERTMSNMDKRVRRAREET